MSEPESILNETQFNETEMVEYFCTAIDKSLTYLSDTYHKDLNKWEMDYRDMKLAKNHPWTNSANFSSPVTSSHTDQTTARLVDDLLGFNEPIDAQCLDNVENNKELEREVRTLMKWDIESHDELREQVWYMIENADWSGNGFAYTYFDQEKEPVTTEEMLEVLVIDGKPELDETGEPIPFDEQMLVELEQLQVPYEVQEVLVQKKELRWTKYEPTTICWSNKDIVFPHDADSLEDAFKNAFVTVRVYKTLDEVYKMMRQPDENTNKQLYNKLDKVKLKASKELFKESTYSTNIKEVKNIEKSLWKSKKMEFFLCWGKYDIDNDDIEEQIVLLLHVPSKTLLGYQEYDYEHKQCPIVNGRIKPIHKKILGTGIPEMLYDIKSYIDTSWNQRIDMRTKFIAPPKVFSKQSGFNPNRPDHQEGIGANWELNDITQIKYMELPSTTLFQHGIQDEERIERLAQRRTGSPDVIFGEGDEKQETFRGMMTLIDETEKFRGSYKKWLAQAIQKIFYQRFRLYRQFWGKAAREGDPQIQAYIQEVLDRPNNNLTQQTLDALDHNFNIVLQATSVDKKVRLVQAKEEHDFLMQDPMVMQSPKYRRTIKENVLRAMSSKNIDEKLPTVEEYEALEQQRVMIAQQEIEAQKQEQEAQIQEVQKEIEFDKMKEREKGRIEGAGGAI